MELIVGKFSGFCNGVKTTISHAKSALIENSDTIYCLGEIIHNPQVVEFLENKGMVTINSIDEAPEGAKVLFRAHGETPLVYEKAKNKNIDILDLTCPLVANIHKKVERESPRAFIIIVGKPTHAEIIGTCGYAGKNYYVVNDKTEVVNALHEVKKLDIKRVFVVVQTTYSTSKFDEIVETIRKDFSDYDVMIDNTICASTIKRQLEAREIAKNVDKMIIIGGKNSSNTKELEVISKANCKEVYLIETVKDLKGKRFRKNDKVGIIAGASTPQESIDQVVDKLKNLKFSKITKSKKEVIDKTEKEEAKEEIKENLEENKNKRI